MSFTVKMMNGEIFEVPLRTEVSSQDLMSTNYFLYHRVITHMPDGICPLNTDHMVLLHASGETVKDQVGDVAEGEQLYLVILPPVFTYALEESSSGGSLTYEAGRMNFSVRYACVMSRGDEVYHDEIYCYRSYDGEWTFYNREQFKRTPREDNYSLIEPVGDFDSIVPFKRISEAMIPSPLLNEEEVADMREQIQNTWDRQQQEAEEYARDMMLMNHDEDFFFEG